MSTPSKQKSQQSVNEIAGSIAHAIVIKNEDLFFLCGPDGQIDLNNGDGLGLYFHDCRYLDGYQVRVGGKKPNTLTASAGQGFLCRFEMTNRDAQQIGGKTLRKQQITIANTRLVDFENMLLDDQLEFRNHEVEPIDVDVEFCFSANFEDVFQVRGLHAQQRGKLRLPTWKTGKLKFCYDGADCIKRELHIGFTPSARHTKNGGVIRLRLDAGVTTTCRIIVQVIESSSDNNKSSAHPPEQINTARALHREQREWVNEQAHVTSDNPTLDKTICRSFRDLRILRSRLHDLEFFAAGLPWYGTLFGRDSLISSLQTLACKPSIAESTLRLLAKYQGTKVDPWRNEQPGKIMHELRCGEMAHLNEIPQTPYYGSVDATPLFLILIAEHASWTGDMKLFRDLQANVRRALQWIDTYANESGEGYVEYSKMSDPGLGNQGWKDSCDAIVNADGTLARSPIALIEVQGETVYAKQRIAELFEREGDTDTATRLQKQAEHLRDKVRQRFWLHGKGIFAMAMQQGQHPCAVVSSNPGHALWTGIASSEQAENICNAMMSSEMFCGWGIRTLSVREKRYNPASYHLGSVWPHDNAFILAGMRRYGQNASAAKLFSAQLRAAKHFEHHRLPEVFCGYGNRQYPKPVHYPVACHPQAWAAGSMPYALQTMLGISANAFENELIITDPVLPDSVTTLKISGVRVRLSSVDIAFHRAGTKLRIEQTKGAESIKLVKR